MLHGLLDPAEHPRLHIDADRGGPAYASAFALVKDESRSASGAWGCSHICVVFAYVTLPAGYLYYKIILLAKQQDATSGA